MKILVQTNKRPHLQLEKEFEKLNESGFEIVPFGYYTRDDGTIMLTGLDDIADDEPTLCRVGIRLLKDSKFNNVPFNKDIFKTIDYTPRSFSVMNMPAHNAFLNLTPHEHAFIRLKVFLNRRCDADFFIKPVDDLKLFGGTFVPAGRTLLEVLTEKNDRQVFTEEELNSKMLVSKNCPRIIEEVRCYVVNRKVVTLSRYRYQDKYNTTPLPPVLEEQYIMYAQRIIDTIYAPGDNFTIDICEIGNNTLRVMEYNCLTTSGLYECDTNKLFTALKEYYYE